MGAWVGKYEKKAAVTGCGSSLQMWNPKDVGLVRKRRISRLLKRNSFLLVQLVEATKSFFLSKTKFWLSSLEQTYGLANENSIICWCTMAPLCDVEWQGTRLIIIFLLFQSTRVTMVIERWLVNAVEIFLWASVANVRIYRPALMR